jgi:hypothetical protein
MRRDMGPVSDLAINLARNRGWSVFPCRNDKKPACPRGFKDAATDPSAITELWRSHPGPLIGIATGAVSGCSVLDVDIKYQAALAWWQDNHAQLPQTRTFRSRSGGLHLFLQHVAGVRNTQSKLCPGLDTRGDGGYIIYWFAAGFECLDNSPLAHWPGWLLAQLLPESKPASSEHRPRRDRGQPAIEGVLRTVATAMEGERNARLYWGACRLGERVRAGLLGVGEAEMLLVAAAAIAGLGEPEARATARSGLQESR